MYFNIINSKWQKFNELSFSKESFDEMQLDELLDAIGIAVIHSCVQMFFVNIKLTYRVVAVRVRQLETVTFRNYMLDLTVNFAI